MKMIKLTGFKKMEWKDGQPTGTIYQSIAYVNPAFIVTIEPNTCKAEKNHYVNIAEQKGCKVQVTLGMLAATYYHNQPPEKLLKQIGQEETILKPK